MSKSQQYAKNTKVSKKVFLFVVINIIVFLLLCTICEYILYCKEIAYFRSEDLPIPKYNLIKEDFSLEKEKSSFHQPFGKKYKKRPIVIYGCSFAFGHRLEPEETMGYILSEKTKRPVFNYSYDAFGLQHALQILNNTKEINNDVEYVLYVFINDHIYRMYNTVGKILCYNFWEYEQKNGEFVIKKDRLKYLKNLLIYKYLKDFYFYHIVTDKQKFNLFMQYLQEINKNIKIKYPNAKFVFIVYNKSQCENLFTDDRIQQIKNLDIDFISLDDIFGNILYQNENIISETDNHPSYKAWKKIVPEIVSIEKM